MGKRLPGRGQRRLSAVAAHVLADRVSDDVAAEPLEVTFGDGVHRLLQPLSRTGRQAFPDMKEGMLADQHLEKRRKAETSSSNLWRIHGKLYDLEPFLDRHPGGRAWLELTRGTDATAAFEAYHLDGAKVQAVLAGYYVRDVKEGEFAHGDRYTYEEDGFWRTLRGRALEVLRREAGERPGGGTGAAKPATGPTAAMRAACAVVLGQFAAAHAVARSTGSVLMAGLSGLLLIGCWGVGHNFMHQAESRAPLAAHAMDLTSLCADDWKITHGLSHHLDTNLPTDWEGTFLVPPLDERSKLAKFTFPVLLPLVGPATLVNSLVKIGRGAKTAFADGGDQTGLRKALAGLPPWLLLASYIRGRRSLRKGLALFCVQMTSFVLAFSPLGVGVHHAVSSGDRSADAKGASPAAQRGTLAWLEGQAGAQDDFGAHQVIATTDHTVFSEGVPAFFRHWLSLSLFAYLNNHTLHHLFPGVDASRLEALRGVFEETLREFGLEEEGRVESRANIIRGFFQYLGQRRVRRSRL